MSISVEYSYSKSGRNVDCFSVDNPTENSAEECWVVKKRETQPAPLRAGYLLYLFLIVFCCQPAMARSKKPPVFELQHLASLCLVANSSIEKCIDFIIEIYADGRVHYQGKKAMSRGRLRQAVRVLGSRYGKITPAQVAELVKTFESFPLEDIQKARELYFAPGSNKVIKYKTETQDKEVADIPFFDVMTTKLNEFINIEKWICFPEGHVEHDDCLLNYRPKYEGL